MVAWYKHLKIKDFFKNVVDTDNISELFSVLMHVWGGVGEKFAEQDISQTKTREKGGKDSRYSMCVLVSEYKISIWKLVSEYEISIIWKDVEVLQSRNGKQHQSLLDPEEIEYY